MLLAVLPIGPPKPSYMPIQKLPGA